MAVVRDRCRAKTTSRRTANSATPASADGVVLSASTTGSEDGPCGTEPRGGKVPVKLDRHLGERIVLDAYTGRPVPCGE
ncbi:hypothetical protein ACIQXA_33320 [Streptomyces massasporeus]|uniref:hypothetical protein n=1 Tax=Streptomyces massasporeus TaxID=67324 RepID=UPI0037F6DE50